jgi:hypothetical protein
MSTDCRWALVLYKSLALLTVYSLASSFSDLYTQAITSNSIRTMYPTRSISTLLALLLASQVQAEDSWNS